MRECLICPPWVIGCAHFDGATVSWADCGALPCDSKRSGFYRVTIADDRNGSICEECGSRLIDGQFYDGQSHEDAALAFADASERLLTYYKGDQ